MIVTKDAVINSPGYRSAQIEIMGCAILNRGKLTNIRGVSDCNAYIYNITGVTAPFPARALAFESGGKRGRNLAIFNISDYDRETNTYTTLKLEKGNGVKVVWMSE